MKYRIGFVTNSSSYSSLVVHHIESATLQSIFEKNGVELSVLEQISGNDDLGFNSDVKPSASKTLITMLNDLLYEYDDEELDELFEDEEIELTSKQLKNIVKGIKKNESEIDSEVSCYIQSRNSSNELEEYYDDDDDNEGVEGNLNETYTLDLVNGKGRFIIESELLDSSDYNKVEELEQDNGVYPVIFCGMTFCILGKLKRYKKEELTKKIEFSGGVVIRSVTKDTNYVVCNNSDSSSSSIKTAQELGIPIISESEFDDIFNDLSKDIDLSFDYEYIVDL